jgi:hypothetical protein
MPTGTPKLERLKAAVSSNFPDAIYGQFNCRRRNGFNWSQHAGSEPAKGYQGNAVDIVHKDHGYGDTSPAHQAWLDQVNAFLVANAERLDLNELIWRKRSHFDHIHTSPWPKLHDAGLYKPPCKGGDLIVRFEDGSRGDTFDVIDEEEDDGMATLEEFVGALRYTDIDKMAADKIIKKSEAEYFKHDQPWPGEVEDQSKKNKEHPDWNNLYVSWKVRGPIWAV